jgi:hypothetical protein
LEAAMRAAARGLVAVAEPLADTRLSKQAERYRLDPWAACEDGYVRVLDLETQMPARFTPNQAQIEMVEAWIDLDHLRKTADSGDPEVRLRNVHEEKSRQFGATTGLSYGMLWLIQHHDVRLLVINVNGDEVDDGGRASTYDSIFGKIRFMAEHVVVGPPDGIETFWPEHLRPGRFLSWRRNPSAIRNRLRPTTYIRGAKATPDPGRGRRYNGALVDEAARLPWGESVQAAITRAIPDGRFYNSTPHGKGNAYYRIRETRPANYIFLRHHWSEHPLYGEGKHVAGSQPHECPLCAGLARGEKWDPSNPVAHRYPGRLTSPWYDDAIIDLTDEQVAAELEIDYEGSLTARVFPEFSADRHADDDVTYDKSLRVEFGIDYGWGASATWVNIYQRAPGELRQIGEVVAMQSTPEQVVAEVQEELAELGMTLLETEARFLRGLRVWGDPAGDARLATGGTLAGEYRKLGFNPQPAPNSIATTINAVKRLLIGQPVRFRVSSRCVKTIRAFEQNRWPTDRTGAIRQDATEPVNDVHNDGMRATAYYVAATFPPPTVEGALAGASAGGTGLPGTGRGNIGGSGKL